VIRHGQETRTVRLPLIDLRFMFRIQASSLILALPLFSFSLSLSLSVCFSLARCNGDSKRAGMRTGTRACVLHNALLYINNFVASHFSARFESRCSCRIRANPSSPMLAHAKKSAGAKSTTRLHAARHRPVTPGHRDQAYRN